MKYYYARCFATGVIASLSLLGIWYYSPIPKPRVIPMKVVPELVVRADVELKQKISAIEKEVVASYNIYSTHRGCSRELAYSTARNAILFKVPAQLISAVVIVESGCKSGIVSPSGAVGEMQVMPKMHNASRSVLMNREKNLEVGTRLLAGLIHKYGIHDGLHHYLGMGTDDGNMTGDDYASRVMQIAKRRK